MVCWCLCLCVSERKFQFNLFSDFSECFNEKTTSIRRGWTELSAKGEAAALHAETSQQSPSNPPPHPHNHECFLRGKRGSVLKITARLLLEIFVAKQRVTATRADPGSTYNANASHRTYSVITGNICMHV